MTCHCGNPFLKHSGEFVTLVGTFSPAGHDHDDNCRTRIYVCTEGHRTTLSRQNRCPACDWRGKLTCFCHEGEKLTEWPAAEQMSRDELLKVL